ncbi:transmembrane protein, putative (macronuclear) [Tetrahymena thermophila SB210]|uniref:Transmembrane protein, putative n=1 Tax=Tetrahymena thermophila (strain SB210) TaxID=312017 RepID=W7XC71_TETTS|nr:transmembrane protein, putative [Tetrahymena thermophila SB210]EWS71306.1 transmembrane protein, putative [Tetrahymena thermophila SB210]|eukprot:XP_012656153.1 transmembrane protein, putative [Tetrahymena thermophila SB210]
MQNLVEQKLIKTLLNYYFFEQQLVCIQLIYAKLFDIKSHLKIDKSYYSTIMQFQMQQIAIYFSETVQSHFHMLTNFQDWKHCYQKLSLKNSFMSNSQLYCRYFNQGFDYTIRGKQPHNFLNFSSHSCYYYKRIILPSSFYTHNYSHSVKNLQDIKCTGGSNYNLSILCHNYSVIVSLLQYKFSKIIQLQQNLFQLLCIIAYPYFIITSTYFYLIYFFNQKSNNKQQQYSKTSKLQCIYKYSFFIILC